MIRPRARNGTKRRGSFTTSEVAPSGSWRRRFLGGGLVDWKSSMDVCTTVPTMSFWDREYNGGCCSVLRRSLLR